MQHANAPRENNFSLDLFERQKVSFAFPKILKISENSRERERESERGGGRRGDFNITRARRSVAVIGRESCSRWIATRLNLNKETDGIIDVGCGNAMTLVELANEGFADLTGVDYSRKAVDLARMVLDDNDLPNVKLLACDILADNNTLPRDGFKVVHDKGTYDAVSLNSENTAAKRRKYIENIHRILSPGGYLVLTSCNWTREELLGHFATR